MISRPAESPQIQIGLIPKRRGRQTIAWPTNPSLTFDCSGHDTYYKALNYQVQPILAETAVEEDLELQQLVPMKCSVAHSMLLLIFNLLVVSRG